MQRWHVWESRAWSLIYDTARELGILQIEGKADDQDWDNPSENDYHMWIPEDGPNWYHFMSLSLKLGG